MLTLVAVAAYLLLLAGVGYRLVGRWIADEALRFLAAFLLGSLAVSAAVGLLAAVHAVGRATLAGVLAVATAVAIASRRDLAGLARALRVHSRALVRDRLDGVLLAVVVSALVLYAVDASVPPRSGDAMRYHLTQMKDILDQGGLVFRPYYHFNFPLYFAFLALPLFAVFGGMAAQQLLLGFVALYALVAWRVARLLGATRGLLVVAVALLTPAMMEAGTTFKDDLPTAVYAFTGILLVATASRASAGRAVLLGGVALGFALGIKYQAVLYLPWFAWLVWRAAPEEPRGRRLGRVAAALAVALVVASPFLVRNALNTGDPVWPLMQDAFAVPRDYLYLVTTQYSDALRGSHTLGYLLGSARELLVNPYLPATLWVLAVPALWRTRRHGLAPAFGLASFFILWWLAQPHFFVRFVNLILPLTFALAVVGFEEGSRGRAGARWAAGGLVTVTLAYGAGMLGWYSADFVRYHVTGDEAAFHEATWYHDELTWMNRRLSPSDTALVILLSGPTYYLDVPYRRADPWLTGTIDWRAVRTPADLRRALSPMGIRYILYDNRDWSAPMGAEAPVGGAEMMRAVRGLVAEDPSRLVWKRRTRLVTSRIRGLSEETETWLIEIDPLGPPAPEAS